MSLLELAFIDEVVCNALGNGGAGIDFENENTTIILKSVLQRPENLQEYYNYFFNIANTILPNATGRHDSTANDVIISDSLDTPPEIKQSTVRSP